MKEYADFITHQLTEGREGLNTTYYALPYQRSLIPVYKEVFTNKRLSLPLLDVLKTYITISDKIPELQLLEYGVRFILVYNTDELVLYVWPQHVTHESFLRNAVTLKNNESDISIIPELSMLRSYYDKIIHDKLDIPFFILPGTLLAREKSIMTNLSQNVVRGLVTKFFDSIAVFNSITKHLLNDLRFFK